MMNDNKKDGILESTFVTQTHGYKDVSSKQELWRQLGVEFSAKFKINRNAGNELEILRLDIPYKKWEIKITESDTRPLKLEIEFVSQLGYELTIGWKDSIDKFLKFIGIREIEIGNENFDNHYLIKSKDKEKTIRLFSSEIIEYILKYNIYSISYSTDIKKHTSKFCSVISRTIDDKKSIEELIYLHKRLIDKFEELRIIKL